jgi:hypothetical protein
MPVCSGSDSEEDAMAKKEGKSPQRAQSSGKIQDLGPGAAEVVRKATDVLESELATGLAAAQKAQRRFRDEKKVDAADLREALSRFREDGHQVVDLARSLTSELRSDSTNELAQRLFKDAHDALDLALGMVELAPDLINRAAQMAGLDKARPGEPRKEGEPKEPRRPAAAGRRRS